MYNWGFQEDRDISNNPICSFLAIYACFLHVFLLAITIVFQKLGRSIVETIAHLWIVQDSCVRYPKMVV